MEKTNKILTEQEIIKEIHNEIDTAQDRLLTEAKRILYNLKINKESDIAKAERLRKLGFINVPIIKSINNISQKKEDVQEQIQKAETDIELIEYYKFNYPFLKFLTEQELNKICKKYNLIYAPVGNYIGNVPEKNIEDIETAKPLLPIDIQKNQLIESGHSYIEGYVKTFWSCRPIYSYKPSTYINKQGLFIVAPKSDFELSNLSNKTEFGFYSEFVTKDPIVFRYCKGGVQVLTKWGLEASDDILVNIINN